MTKDIRSVNVVHLVGSLGFDPVSETRGGKSVCNISLQLNEAYMKDGREVKEKFFVRVTMFGKAAENLPKYARKGDVLHIEARLRNWQKEGEKYPILQLVSPFSPTKIASRNEDFYSDDGNNTPDFTDQSIPHNF